MDCRQRLSNLFLLQDPQELRRLVLATAPDSRNLWKVWYLVPESMSLQEAGHRVADAYRFRVTPRYLTFTGGEHDGRIVNGFPQSTMGLPWHDILYGNDQSEAGTAPLFDLFIDDLYLPVCGVTVTGTTPGSLRLKTRFFFHDLLDRHPELKALYVETFIDWQEEQMRHLAL